MLKKFMKFIVIFMLTSPTFATNSDIVDGSTALFASESVAVESVKTAAIIQEQNSWDGQVGILALEVEVEGNICGADPKTLSVHLRSVEGNEYIADLLMNRTLKLDPVPRVCRAYSSPATVKVYVNLSKRIVNGSSLITLSDEAKVRVTLGADNRFSSLLSNNHLVFKVRVI